MGNSVPVIHRARGEARKMTPFAISMGSPSLRSAVLDRIPSVNSAGGKRAGRNIRVGETRFGLNINNQLIIKKKYNFNN